MPKHISGIDHLVILVADLEAAAQTFTALGFTLSPRGVHSAHMGTANYTIMLQNDYFELLAPIAETPLNAPMRARLEGGDGLYATALRTDDAAGMYDELVAAGVGAEPPVSFQRPVDLPDGSVGEAAFKVTRLVEPGTARDQLFGCEQLTRDTVWLPALMRHANGATGLAAVDAVSNDPAAAAGALSVLFGTTPEVIEGGVRLMAGEVVITLTPGGNAPLRLTGMSLAVDDIAKTKGALAAVPFAEGDGAISVAPEAAHGVALTFVAP
ncbi:MAG: VOC family protein [Pseudomonadota bacterium]